MSSPTLEKLMQKQEDPAYVELQTRYTNARISVDMGYRLARNVEGAEFGIAAYVGAARELAKEIETDLNATLSILEPKSVSKA